jgi:hypothetical protein
MEGTAANSPQAETTAAKAHTFALHIGGWKDMPADETGVQRFVNNNKTISLNLGTTVSVKSDLAPTAHVLVDVLKVLNGANVDFSATYSIHAPKAGQSIANQLPNAFVLDHVHQ